jgi:hypothetical protein
MDVDARRLNTLIKRIISRRLRNSAAAAPSHPAGEVDGVELSTSMFRN